MTANVRSLVRMMPKRVEDASDPDNYNVPHTAVTYLMNADGGDMAHFLDGADVEHVANKMRDLRASILPAEERCGSRPDPQR